MTILVNPWGMHFRGGDPQLGLCNVFDLVTSRWDPVPCMPVENYRDTQTQQGWESFAEGLLSWPGLRTPETFWPFTE